MSLDYEAQSQSGPPTSTDPDWQETVNAVNPNRSEAQRLQTLVAKIKKDEQSRESWRDKQAAWNRMRTVGLGRISLPFRGASDFHFPLADTFIEKLKPFYYQQALQPDPLCSFIPRKTQARSVSTLASHWFDYQVRTLSNYRKALPVLIDLMLERGKGIMKTVWDHDNRCLLFEAVDPVNFIVPPSTDVLEDALRCTHVLYLNKSDYIRMAKEQNEKGKGGWNTDTSWVRSCLGPRPDIPEVEQDKQWISGIQFDEDDELMILWETYSIGPDGKIIIDLINPNKPAEPARPPVYDYPYRHGVFPFVEFVYERKSRGFYENRGVPEIVAQFEQELCKLENEKLDYMTYVNRPIFTHKGASINPGNLRMAPGQIIGNELSAVEFPAPPIDFDTESRNIRSIAEERVGMPDFGLGRSNDFSQPRTAKEAEMLQQYNNQGVDLRGRVFDEGLHELYWQSWKLLLQYNQDDLEYTYRHEVNELDQEALADIYILTPNGNPDGYDKNQEISRLINLAQVPGVSKFINPEKFARTILELADPRYLRELFMPGGLNTNQMEKQADEIGNMLNGFAISVQPDDDPMAHIQALLQYFDFAEQAKIQVPILPSLYMYQHFMQHYQQAAQMDPQGFKQAKQVLDAAKGRIESSLPILQQALKDGLPPMASVEALLAHVQQLQAQAHQQPPLGPLQANGTPQQAPQPGAPPQGAPPQAAPQAPPPGGAPQ